LAERGDHAQNQKICQDNRREKMLSHLGQQR
jgi:hypothetical protein